ncbi:MULTISPECIES: hypothetical protein [unclassified Streptomyces]|uniref:hypothetical protein n=1 Tax=unclassified Streptomyces TaxID=2593676 RepID=UPI00225A8A76|nr:MULTISPECIES: hypothetical protein [unclassified Streptomyces]MCX5145358.1 hypothetical protein [Streptomyces sp. NBC_00320]WSN48670.1 hypothetical protein OG299_13680 [Streptomyces sp. NBC_01296]WSW61918.1 hypothetical protein OG513_26935 [Streptomyces sp. NBC_00998]
MLVALIIACEIAFWVLLAGGLALRYLAKMPRLGAAVLLCEPLLELVLLVVTTLDLKNGGAPSWTHGLAALYLGYTVGYGHYTVKWLDRHAAYRFGGGPKPPGPKYGKARAVHEWKLWTRTLAAAAVALGLLQAAIWYVGDAADTGGLQTWQFAALRVLGIQAVIAATYTLWPRKAPAAEPQEEPAEVRR